MDKVKLQELVIAIIEKKLDNENILPEYSSLNILTPIVWVKTSGYTSVHVNKNLVTAQQNFESQDKK